MIKCPVCGREYEPVLKMKPGFEKVLIQELYPDAEPWQREQLISGICSDGCWEILFEGMTIEE